MIYLLLRAVFVPMLHDSIATFFRYVHIHEVWPYYSEWSANNHFLNSLLMLGSYELFGSSPFALKLPNVIFFPVYFYFVWEISGRIRNTYLQWGFVISMLFAHNFFEFFGTGRGYGMSMGLIAGAVYFAMEALDHQRPKDFAYTFLFLILANYANLTLMNTFIILTGLLLLSFIFSQQKYKTATELIFVFLGIIPIIFFIVLLFRIKAEGELYYGKPDGFIEVSLMTLGKLLTGARSGAFVFFAILLYTLTLVIFIGKMRSINKDGWASKLFHPNLVFFYLITGSFIASILENKLFGINYPEDRTGLYLYPFLTGALFFGLDQVKTKKRWYPLIPALPFLFFPVHFLTHLNLSWSSMENQAIPQRFHDRVTEDHTSGNYPDIVQGYQGRVMRWAYMNFREGTQTSRIFFEDYPSMNGDYQIADISDHPEWLTRYDSVDSDRRTGFSLLKRKHKLVRKPIFHISDMVAPQFTSKEYHELYRGPVDSLRGKPLFIGYTIDLIAQQNPFHGWTVVTVYNDQNETLRYEYVPFDWYRTNWTESGNPFTNGIYIADLPKNATSMVIYIWNIQKLPFRIAEGQLDIFYLQKD